MVQETQQSHVEADVLEVVRRGLPVYDSEYVKLGRVIRIYWGTENEHPDSDDFETLILGVASLPSDAGVLIQQEGCIRVDSGLLFGDYYVLPNQIDYLTEEGIILLARGDELMMF